MTWVHAALAGAILLASGMTAAAQDEGGPVPPVYVPEEQRDNVPAGPPAICQGRNCLPPEQNPVRRCEGQGCQPEPLAEPPGQGG